MKKIVIIIMGLLIMFGTCACGSGMMFGTGEKTDEELAYEAAETVVKYMNNRDYRNANEMMSKKCLELSGQSIDDDTSQDRQLGENYKIRDYKIVESFYGTEYKFWRYLIGYRYTDDNRNERYTEQSIYFFKENDQMVWVNEDAFNKYFDELNIEKREE